MNYLNELISDLQVLSFCDLSNYFTEEGLLEVAPVLQAKSSADAMLDLNGNQKKQNYIFVAELLSSKITEGGNIYHFTHSREVFGIRKEYIFALWSGGSAMDTQMKKIAPGTAVLVKFLGLQANPQKGGKPFNSFYIKQL